MRRAGSPSSTARYRRVSSSPFDSHDSPARTGKVVGLLCNYGNAAQWFSEASKWTGSEGNRGARCSGPITRHIKSKNTLLGWLWLGARAGSSFCQRKWNGSIPPAPLVASPRQSVLGQGTWEAALWWAGGTVHASPLSSGMNGCEWWHVAVKHFVGSEDEKRY